MADRIPIYKQGDRVASARRRFKTIINLKKCRTFDDSGLDGSASDNSCLSKEDEDQDMQDLERKPNFSADGGGGGTKKLNCTLKLFDRCVDIAKFTNTTSLYPVCRDWLKPKPKYRSFKPQMEDRTSGNADKSDNAEPYFGIYCLPKPLPIPQRYNTYGIRLNHRIPPPLASTEGHESIWAYIESHQCDNDEDDGLPSPALLFRNHLDRWILIKNRWRNAYAINDRRYKNSFAVLARIFNEHSMTSRVPDSPITLSVQ